MKKGFTLIELLVVIAIIGLIASTNKKGWQACSTKEVSADRLEKYILENLERYNRG